MATDGTPSAIFLGIAERAAYLQDRNTHVLKLNILGLRNNVLSYIFPLTFPQWHFVVALSTTSIGRPCHWSLVDESGKELGHIDINSEVLQTSGQNQTQSVKSDALLGELPWFTYCFPLGNSGIVIERPGNVQIRDNSPTGELLGIIDFILVEPPALNAERIAAIRSDPSASKAIRVSLGCKYCDAKLYTYSALERDAKSEADNWKWYENLPDKFECDCHKTNLPLDILRRNLHGLLGIPRTESKNIQFIPQYEIEGLRALRNRFSALLDENRREEDLQDFISKNPVLLHSFPAVRLFTKPPILTEFVADFAIVSPNKDLVLIEIEKTGTRLLNKDGGRAAALVHAFDQVHSWLHVADEHRVAFLNSLKIERSEVSNVKGLVIAGRDLGYDSLHLRRLKGQDFGRISFLTYDDLLFSLDSLIEKMGQL